MIPLKDSIPSRRWPLINVSLILLNLVAFLYEVSMPSAQDLTAFIQTRAVVPLELLTAPGTEWPTVFIAMFLHGGWSHVIGNLLYLWIFGDNVEDRMGHLGYLFFYLLVGVSATLAQAFMNPLSPVPMLGASGAIAGVLGAYFVLFPKSRILALVPIWVFIRVVEIPAIFFLGFWFVFQAIQGWGSIVNQPLQGPGGGIAWGAHAGGFLAGMALVFPFTRRRR